MINVLPPRRLIPRWRKARSSVHQRDMLGLVKPVLAGATAPLRSLQEDVERALRAWKTTDSIGDLADLLAFGIAGKV